MGLQIEKKAAWLGVSQESHIYVFCLSLWLSDLSNLFDISITHLWILRKVTKPKPSKSVKILEKRNKKQGRWNRNRNGCSSSQHICFGRMTWLCNNFRSIFHTSVLRLIPQLVMSSFIIVLQVPYIPINAYSVKTAD